METSQHHLKSLEPAPSPKEKKKENMMSFLQANEKLEDDRVPTTMPTSAVIKHDEFKDYNGVRRAPQEEKREEVRKMQCFENVIGSCRSCPPFFS